MFEARSRPLGCAALLLLTACAEACGGEVPKAALVPPAASAGPETTPALGRDAGGFRDVVSARFGMRVPLPDARAWSVEDQRGTWLLAQHPPSSSELATRTWNEPGVVNRTRCEEEARLRRVLPEREGAEIVERRVIGVPPGFDTVVEVGVAPLPAAGRGRRAQPGTVGQGVRAFAMAFGGKGHRCFAYVYTTSASGPGAEHVIGERLATMVQGSLQKVSLESGLELHREPVPVP